MSSKVGIKKCLDYHTENVERALREALSLIGGIASFIKPSARVLLKPNLLMAIEPDRAITTHPEIIRAVIHILKEINAEIYLGDTPSVFGKSEDLAIEEVYKKTGMYKLASEEGIKLVELKEKNFKKGLPLTGFLDNVDAVVNIPKFKTHGLMILTGAVKNLFGLIPGLSKSEMHKKYFRAHEFAAMLVDVYQAVLPVINIVDAVEVIEGDGPATSGEKRRAGLILAGADAVAVDSVLARLMNLMPNDIPVIKEAQKRGLGNSALASLEILGESLDDVIIPDFKLPKTSLVYKIPKPVFNLIKKLLDYRPRINPKICIRCKKCQTICPKQVITIEPKIKIDYSGCIRCFCCQEVCPVAAISVKKSFTARMLGMRG